MVSVFTGDEGASRLALAATGPSAAAPAVIAACLKKDLLVVIWKCMCVKRYVFVMNGREAGVASDERNGELCAVRWVM